MSMTNLLLIEIIGTLLGIFVGTLAALAVDRHNERRRNQQRAKIILHALALELENNKRTLQAVRPAYQSTPWGESFYVSTIAWETALSSGDLPGIIGTELADHISSHYSLLVRVRYYVDLLTKVWFAPDEIQDYEKIQEGFRRKILEAINQALSMHPHVIAQIAEQLQRDGEVQNWTPELPPLQETLF